jgi:hypothetical protein
MQISPELLGFRGDPKWRDMSDYLVHFTSGDALYSILSDRHLEARNEFGWFRSDHATSSLRISACLSEVPIDQIDRLAARRGRFGIGFKRDFVQNRGGARVWYAEGLQSNHLFEAFKEIRRSDPTRAHAMWKLTPFIDDVSSAYDFTWEREWRVPGGFKFDHSQVAFLIIPQSDGPSVFENPAPGVPLLSSDSLEFWNQAFHALGGPEDKWVDEFLTEFIDPNVHLVWDKETGDYSWFWKKWSTEDAVAWLFSNLDYDAESSLVLRLNEIAPYWLKVSELADNG